MMMILRIEKKLLILPALLGGLLASGEVTDPKEIHFLTEKLEQLKTDGKSSHPSESRRRIALSP